MTQHYKPNLHCMICDRVYYAKEKIWMPKQTFQELELGQATSSVYHAPCAERYLNEYVPSIPSIDKNRFKKLLEERIREAS